jgi:hypothetical protein
MSVTDPGTLTGSNHPETSHEAAARALGKSGSARRRVLAALTKFALTDDEMQYLLRMPANTQRPRRVELVEMGYVQSTGLRRTTPSGAEAIVWYASPKGRTALASTEDTP